MLQFIFDFQWNILCGFSASFASRSSARRSSVYCARIPGQCNEGVVLQHSLLSRRAHIGILLTTSNVPISSSPHTVAEVYYVVFWFSPTYLSYIWLPKVILYLVFWLSSLFTYTTRIHICIRIRRTCGRSFTCMHLLLLETGSWSPTNSVNVSNW